MEMKYSKTVRAIYHLKKVIASSIPHGSREEFPGGICPHKPVPKPFARFQALDQQLPSALFCIANKMARSSPSMSSKK